MNQDNVTIKDGIGLLEKQIGEALILACRIKRVATDEDLDFGAPVLRAYLYEIAIRLSSIADPAISTIEKMKAADRGNQKRDEILRQISSLSMEI